jgi:nucleotide-binding universal stress UspA family protein
MRAMKILVAIDFSESSPLILQRAAGLAALLSAQVWLVHVAAPDPDFVGYEAGPQVVREQVSRRFYQEHQRLQAEAQILRDRGINTTPLLIQGPTVPTLLHEADKLDADIIVVGSHGHGAVYQLLVGSVSEGLLRKATRPVLVIPTRREG